MNDLKCLPHLSLAWKQDYREDYDQSSVETSLLLKVTTYWIESYEMIKELKFFRKMLIKKHI
jgi:hypothetical protein